jgi:hypothetical protein
MHEIWRSLWGVWNSPHCLVAQERSLFEMQRKAEEKAQEAIISVPKLRAEERECETLTVGHE